MPLRHSTSVMHERAGISQNQGKPRRNFAKPCYGLRLLRSIEIFGLGGLMKQGLTRAGFPLGSHSSFVLQISVFF